MVFPLSTKSSTINALKSVKSLGILVASLTSQELVPSRVIMLIVSILFIPRRSAKKYADNKPHLVTETIILGSNQLFSINSANKIHFLCNSS